MNNFNSILSFAGTKKIPTTLESIPAVGTLKITAQYMESETIDKMNTVVISQKSPSIVVTASINLLR